MIYDRPILKPSGDRGIKISFGNERSLQVNKRVRLFCRRIERDLPQYFDEIVPTYADLTVTYDERRFTYEEVAGAIEPLVQSHGPTKNSEGGYRVLFVPVCYEGIYAPDMEYVCSYTNMEREEVVSLHTSSPYYVFQLGFTPGCPFIGPLQKNLHVPLMQIPRTDTPEGAVSISIGQTVIYPRASPGGMRLIGRTPVRLFQIDHPETTLFKPGDWVMFYPINKDTFKAMHESINELMEGVEMRTYES